MKMKKTQRISINANVDAEIFKRFRKTVYLKSGLKKGDLSGALEEAMLGYILIHSKSKSALDFVRRIKRENECARRNLHKKDQRNKKTKSD